MDDSEGTDSGLVPSRRVARRARRRPPLTVDADPVDSQESALKQLSASAAALAAEVRELRAVVHSLTDKVERLDERMANGPATEKLRPTARRPKKPVEPSETARPRSRAQNG